MPGPVSDQAPSLPERMRARAMMDTQHCAELIEMADRLEAACGPDVPIPKLVGTWAKCRRRWCEITGEALI